MSTNIPTTATILGSLIRRGIKFSNRFEVLRNHDAASLQRDTLRRLLTSAEHTAFGAHYRFERLLRYQDIAAAYADNVPTHDYDKLYDEWWHRAVAQEPDVCWPGTVRYFALSSGTSGAPSKYIPVTDAMTKSMQKAGRKMFFSLTRYDLPMSLFTKGMMMVGGSAALNVENGFYSGDLSGINANKIPYWLRRYYKPGVEIASIPDWNERIERIARNAHTWDIGFLTGIPSWIQLMLERVIEYQKIDTIHDIWPNVSVYVSGGIALEPYKQGMRRLFDRDIVYIDSYLASEGFIAFQNRPNSEQHAMAMILNNGIYFEFVPFDDHNFDGEGNLKPNHQTLSVWQVELGKDYAILMTTCAGAWRYLIGDTVRFTDLARCEILITGRTKHFLSITGEHLSVDNMNRAVQLTAADFGVAVREFTVSAAEYAPGQFEHRWYIGCEPSVDKVLFQDRLDNYLKAINDDYRTERGAFLRIRLEVLPTDYFYEFQRLHAKFDGQAKFPRVMKNDRFELWENFLRSK
jgi:hypothetical protein